MSNAGALASGKGHHDENFPVASFLIAPRHRAPVLAFYRFARLADDVADNGAAPAAQRLALLEDMRASLTGTSDVSPEGVALRDVLAARGLGAQHGLDLLEAFRRDVTKSRYDDWDDLMDYCRYSAMPVGRFVLDVHGEDARATWPASDALCAALQVINHLQDCAKDYRALNRVYLPLDAQARHGAALADLDGAAATPGLLAAIRETAAKNAALLQQSRDFSGKIVDARLALEVAVIQTLAEDLNGLLMRRDPLSQNVHHGKTRMAVLGLAALFPFALGRASRLA